MVRICAIGDPHGSLEKVRKIPKKGIELFLLTGDLGSANLMREQAFENIKREKEGLPEKEYTPKQKKEASMEAYNSSMRIVEYLRKFAPVYTIFGNVESHNSEVRKRSKEIGLPLPFLYDDLNKLKNVRIINNRLANYQGIKIGGLEYFKDTNWVQEFKPQDYRETMKEAKKETDKARRVVKNFGSIDILLCHQPPYGILDKVTAKFAPKEWQGKHAGSKPILKYIQKEQPRYVFCGHIHEGEGKKRIGQTKVYNLGMGSYKIVEI